eukprot:361569-Chlamydomonas_euryale.AAC.3
MVELTGAGGRFPARRAGPRAGATHARRPHAEAMHTQICACCKCTFCMPPARTVLRAVLRTVLRSVPRTLLLALATCARYPVPVYCVLCTVSHVGDRALAHATCSASPSTAAPGVLCGP